MIAANELRIGNFVYRKVLAFNAISKVVLIDVHFLNVRPEPDYEDEQISIDAHGEDFSGVIAGIPLTEEWLVKFGFTKNERRRWQIKGSHYAIFYYSYTANEGTTEMYRIEFHDQDYGKDEYVDCRQWVDRLKYVHQLQNLYFALTNTELIWNGKQ